MSDRRETPRKPRPAKGASPKARFARQNEANPWQEGERIAKYLARCGVASRREVETLIAAGKVSVNGQILASPAFKVLGHEKITVSGRAVAQPDAPRLWRYHKPAGLLTTNQDPDGRRTIFQELPKALPRTITIGRLDFNTEGLLLLTNDGELARALELPEHGLKRRYRARAHGRASQDKLDTLAEGIVIDRITYAPIFAKLERQTGANCWIDVELTEGKKREVRRALESVGLEVNRLIRTDYGPLELGALKPGGVEEVPSARLPILFGEILPQSVIDRLAATSRFEGTRNRSTNKGHKGRKGRAR